MPSIQQSAQIIEWILDLAKDSKLTSYDLKTRLWGDLFETLDKSLDTDATNKLNQWISAAVLFCVEQNPWAWVLEESWTVLKELYSLAANHRQDHILKWIWELHAVDSISYDYDQSIFFPKEIIWQATVARLRVIWVKTAEHFKRIMKDDNKRKTLYNLFDIYGRDDAKNNVIKAEAFYASEIENWWDQAVDEMKNIKQRYKEIQQNIGNGISDGAKKYRDKYSDEIDSNEFAYVLMSQCKGIWNHTTAVQAMNEKCYGSYKTKVIKLFDEIAEAFDPNIPEGIEYASNGVDIQVAGGEFVFEPHMTAKSIHGWFEVKVSTVWNTWKVQNGTSTLYEKNNKGKDVSLPMREVVAAWASKVDVFPTYDIALSLDTNLLSEQGKKFELHEEVTLSTPDVISLSNLLKRSPLPSPTINPGIDLSKISSLPYTLVVEAQEGLEVSLTDAAWNQLKDTSWSPLVYKNVANSSGQVSFNLPNDIDTSFSQIWITATHPHAPSNPSKMNVLDISFPKEVIEKANPFSITPVIATVWTSEVISEEITINGLSKSNEVTITAGEVSVDGGMSWATHTDTKLVLPVWGKVLLKSPVWTHVWDTRTVSLTVWWESADFKIETVEAPVVSTERPTITTPTANQTITRGEDITFAGIFNGTEANVGVQEFDGRNWNDVAGVWVIGVTGNAYTRALSNVPVGIHRYRIGPRDATWVIETRANEVNVTVDAPVVSTERPSITTPALNQIYKPWDSIEFKRTYMGTETAVGLERENPIWSGTWTLVWSPITLTGIPSVQYEMKIDNVADLWVHRYRIWPVDARWRLIRPRSRRTTVVDIEVWAHITTIANTLDIAGARNERNARNPVISGRWKPNTEWDLIVTQNGQDVHVGKVKTDIHGRRYQQLKNIGTWAIMVKAMIDGTNAVRSLASRAKLNDAPRMNTKNVTINSKTKNIKISGYLEKDGINTMMVVDKNWKSYWTLSVWERGPISSLIDRWRNISNWEFRWGTRRPENSFGDSIWIWWVFENKDLNELYVLPSTSIQNADKTYDLSNAGVVNINRTESRWEAAKWVRNSLAWALPFMKSKEQREKANQKLEAKNKLTLWFDSVPGTVAQNSIQLSWNVTPWKKVKIYSKNAIWYSVYKGDAHVDDAGKRTHTANFKKDGNYTYIAQAYDPDQHVYGSKLKQNIVVQLPTSEQTKPSRLSPWKRRKYNKKKKAEEQNKNWWAETTKKEATSPDWKKDTTKKEKKSSGFWWWIKKFLNTWSFSDKKKNEDGWSAKTDTEKKSAGESKSSEWSMLTWVADFLNNWPKVIGEMMPESEDSELLKDVKGVVKYGPGTKKSKTSTSK